MEYVICREGNEDYLEHFGVKGQKWGVRRFENEDGTLTEAGKIRYAKAQKEASKYESKSDRLKKIGRAARTGAAAGAAAGAATIFQTGYGIKGLQGARDYAVGRLGYNVAGIAATTLAGGLGGAAISGIKQGYQAAKVRRGQKFIEKYKSAYEKTYGGQS